MTPKPCAVYWLYAEGDAILYIGVTENPRARFAVHKNKKDWWPQVVRRHVEWFTTRDEALRRETVELRTHRPPCNPVIPEEDGTHITRIGGKRQTCPPPWPKPTARSTRIGPIWEEARAIAKERGDKLPAIIEAALRRYVARHRRTKKEGKP